MEKYDFSGWATKNNLKCSDGRTIRHNAFKDCDGLEVPLVWNHSHNEPSNVLGHALLKNMNDGVYCYGTFNDTASGQVAKTLVQHGDITALSIYANHLKQVASDVVHGVIREVSLVHAGANPGAFIDTVIAHSDEADEEAIIYTGENFSLAHSDEEKDEEKKEDKKVSKEEKTVQDVIDTMDEDQKSVMEFLIGQAIEENGNQEDEEDMKHNVFDNDVNDDNVLMHDAMQTIIADGKRFGSLKESFLQHKEEYGIENIDYLFPDAKPVNGNVPTFIKRTPDGWANTVMSGVHHTPFPRIKMVFADITEDEARAKGYLKGKLKKEEVFSLLKRTVDPTTVYKKQKLDRDDIVDITDFDVVTWLKAEMRMMLDEEIARAIVFGDGRSASSEDHIDGTKIIPIVADAELYTISTEYDGTAKGLITAAVKGQNDYEGSGNTTMFVSNNNVTDMLLIEDAVQHRLYKDITDLAMACSVSRIVKVPASIIPKDVAAVIVDLNDYNVGADKGGSVNMFDDFDIDYNQQKYLIETRCSGALTKPHSAVVIKKKSSTATEKSA